ncbi:MAG: hypothetical protein ACP5VP_05500 [Candidatus Limnocylindrales bacterium]
MDGRWRRATGRLFLGIAWVVAALLISLGAAGLAVSADHLPGDATRPERTWVQDMAFQSRIRSLGPRYDALSADVGRLGDTARTALADLVARRADLLASDLAEGDALVTSIDSQVAQLGTALDAVQVSARPSLLGDHSLAMLASARAALDTTRPIPGDWRSLADQALPAIQLAGVLQRHDSLVFSATQQARAGRYATALATLKDAGAALGQARQTRDALQSRADMSTLTTYIDRMRAYDQALTALYTELGRTGGRLNATGQQLVARVAAAQQLLPPDTRAIVVIMGNVAQAGLNQAAIAIEEARGNLGNAVAALHLVN